MFAMMTPVEYGSIVGQVIMSPQVQVALLLVKQKTCPSPVNIAWLSSEGLLNTLDPNWSRHLFMPSCNDLSMNCKLIKDSLSEWEQIITIWLFEDGK
jgi:hypothetical protein